MTGGAKTEGGAWASAAFFAVLVAGGSFIVDAGVRGPFDTPKTFLVLVVTAAALALWAVVGAWRRAAIELSAVDGLLAAGIVIEVASNPALLTHSDDLLLPLALALLLVTFLTRQLTGRTDSSGSTPPAESGSGWDLIHVLWISGAALALLGLRQAWSVGVFQYVGGLMKTPMMGPLGTANGYGALVALGVAGALASATRARPGLRSLLLAAAALCAFALLANGSRGATLGLVVGVAIAFAAHPRTAETRLMWWMRRNRAAAVAIGATLALVLAGGLALLNTGSSGGRLMVWRIAGPMVLDHPLTGVGAGRFGAEFPGYQARFFAQAGNLRWAYKAADLSHPHSDVLFAFAETGVPGGLLNLLLWILAAVWLGRAALRAGTTRRPMYAGLLAVLLLIVVHGTVDTIQLVVPVAVVAHAILGLVPAPSVRIRPGRAAWVLVAMAALGYGGLRIRGAFRTYSGYESWERASLFPGPRAVPQARAALAVLPHHPEVEVALGKALVSADSVEEGVRYLEGALQMGADPDAQLSLAEAYLTLGNPNAAERHARAYLSVYPDRLRPRLLLGRVYLARGEQARAREELARCIRKETHARSSAVDAVSKEADALWRSHFPDAPPSPAQLPPT